MKCNDETRNPESNPNSEIRMPNLDVVGDNIEVPGSGPEPWMLELAKMLILKDLPTGVIVGTAVIAKCEEVEDRGSKMEDRELKFGGLVNSEYSIFHPRFSAPLDD